MSLFMLYIVIWIYWRCISRLDRLSMVGVLSWLCEWTLKVMSSMNCL